jgi:hypothetical protein
MFEAAQREVLGVVHPWTIAICAMTIVFAVALSAALFTAIRCFVRADRPALLGRLVPTACSIAAFALALWLDTNDIIGLRTWAW